MDNDIALLRRAFYRFKDYQQSVEEEGKVVRSLTHKITVLEVESEFVTKLYEDKILELSRRECALARATHEWKEIIDEKTKDKCVVLQECQLGIDVLQMVGSDFLFKDTKMTEEDAYRLGLGSYTGAPKSYKTYTSAIANSPTRSSHSKNPCLEEVAKLLSNLIWCRCTHNSVRNDVWYLRDKIHPLKGDLKKRKKTLEGLESKLQNLEVERDRSKIHLKELIETVNREGLRLKDNRQNRLLVDSMDEYGFHLNNEIV
ncbi:hypothetical protein LguiA_028255 [Lonicera macranthoides]